MKFYKLILVGLLWSVSSHAQLHPLIVAEMEKSEDTVIRGLLSGIRGSGENAFIEGHLLSVLRQDPTSHNMTRQLNVALDLRVHYVQPLRNRSYFLGKLIYELLRSRRVWLKQEAELTAVENLILYLGREVPEANPVFPIQLSQPVTFDKIPIFATSQDVRISLLRKLETDLDILARDLATLVRRNQKYYVWADSVEIVRVLHATAAERLTVLENSSGIRAQLARYGRAFARSCLMVVHRTHL